MDNKPFYKNNYKYRWMTERQALDTALKQTTTNDIPVTQALPVVLHKQAVPKKTSEVKQPIVEKEINNSEKNNNESNPVVIQPQAPIGRFVRGGWNRTTMRKNKLGEHPQLRTSKGTSTEEVEERETPPVQLVPRKRCEIPLDYERVNQMQLEGYLTKTAVFDMTRLYIAYLSHNREGHYEGNTFTSVGIKLRAMGFPKEVDKIKKVYLTFCKSQGVSEEEVEKDLRTFGTYVRERRIGQSNLSERNRREEVRRAFEKRPAGCDPDCVIQ